MHVSPWQPSCLPLCGLPAAFWEGSRRSPARWRSLAALRRRPAPDRPYDPPCTVSGRSWCPHLHRTSVYLQLKYSLNVLYVFHWSQRQQVKACEHERTDKASRCCVLQVVVFSEQWHDLGEDGFAHQFSFLVFGHDTRPHLDLLTHLKLQKGGGRFRREHNS